MNILKDEICDLASIDRDVEVVKIVLEQQFYRLSQKRCPYIDKDISNPHITQFLY